MSSYYEDKEFKIMVQRVVDGKIDIDFVHEATPAKSIAEALDNIVSEREVEYILFKQVGY